MFPQYRELIIKNFVTLVKECDMENLTKIMVDKGIFTKQEIENIFLTADDRHNRRVFFFSLQRKEQRSFNVLIDFLIDTNKKDIADMLQQKRTGCTLIVKPNYDEDEELTRTISRPVHVDHSVTPLDIEVKLSDRFHDQFRHDMGFEFYYSRSKNRGRVLIINNYDFGIYKKHPYRSGATVDNSNLERLFSKMGGWDVQIHNNKTAVEMQVIIKSFAEDKVNKQYDICFMIIMSHGSIDKNETIIYGIDNQFIYESQVQKEFNNENCKLFIAKPKVLIFQMCRGDDHDYTITHVTETDGLQAKPMVNMIDTEPTVTNVRTQDDILIGHSTLLGYKAHRDIYRGSWYIEILCERFMNYAHMTPVDDLLTLVDQGLRRRMSENHSMQTAEHSNKGFKKLYLHPGIYEEHGAIKSFFN